MEITIVVCCLYPLIYWICHIFSLKTETPLLIMVSWWILNGGIYSYFNEHKPKLFRWLMMIPLIEFLVFVVMFTSMLLIPDWVNNERGWLLLCAFFDSIINGVLYLGTLFSNHKHKTRNSRRKK